jgi:hypothetical protein
MFAVIAQIITAILDLAVWLYKLAIPTTQTSFFWQAAAKIAPTFTRVITSGTLGALEFCDSGTFGSRAIPRFHAL